MRWSDIGHEFQEGGVVVTGLAVGQGRPLVRDLIGTPSGRGRNSPPGVGTLEAQGVPDLL